MLTTSLNPTSWQGVLPPFLSAYDLTALAYFLALWLGYTQLSGSKGFVRRSLIGAIQEQRILWMQNMVRRDNRVLDQVLLSSLSQGSAFFASTSAIAIGGLAAMMGSGEKVQSLTERLPYAVNATPLLFEFKLLLIMFIFVYAFFKFAWAFRLSHYAAIMIGATPLLKTMEIAAGHKAVDPADPMLPHCEHHGRLAAQVAGLSAEHSNGGVRAFYYAIAAATWFYHPFVFMAATTWVLLILVRRDFFSRSRAMLHAANETARACQAANAVPSSTGEAGRAQPHG